MRRILKYSPHCSFLYTFIMDHRHHIIPKHEWKKRFGNLCGVNAPDNLVCLTTEQHAQAHKFLYELNKNKLDAIAYESLSKLIGKEEITKAVSRIVNIGNSNRKGKGLGATPWNKGKQNTITHSEETINYLREINSREKHPQYGTTHSIETRRKISIANSRPYDPERRARKLSLVRTPEHREKMRQARLRYLSSKKDSV